MSELNRFVEWLSYSPSYKEIAQALILDYLSDLQPARIRFGQTLADDSAVVLGQFGYKDPQVPIGSPIPGKVWRSLETPDIHIISNANPIPWSPNGDVFVIVLRDHGVIHGHAVFEFDYSVKVEDRECVLGRLNDYCILVSLYISLLSRGQNIDPIQSFTFPEDSRVGTLSPRQIEVLRAVVAGKTNIQIARQLGYSLSTIRQETIKIYLALSVNSRREAAKKALELSLV